MVVRLSERPYRVAMVVVFIMVAVWFAARIVGPAAGRLTHGFGAYYSASRLLVTGTYSERVYEPDYFRAVVRSDSQGEVEDIWPNPPPTTLMMAPIAGLDIRTARVVWTAINVILLFGGLSTLIWNFAPRAPMAVWLLIFTVGMVFRPVIANFVFGQAYVLVFALLVLAVIGIDRRWDITGGVSLGLALALKLVGWPLGFLLIWLQRWRYLAVYGATVALLVLASIPLLGLASWRGFFTFLPQITGSPLICVPAYQTTRSWLCHVLVLEVLWQEVATLALPWYAPVILVAAGVLTLVLTLALANRQPMAAAGGLIAWGVLFAPLGEEHHQVVLLIPIVWLILMWWSGYPLSRATLILLGLALIFYTVPFPINHPRLQQGWLALLAYPRLYGAWMVWLAILLGKTVYG